MAGNPHKEMDSTNGDLRLMISFLNMLPVPAFIKESGGALLYLNHKAEQLWKVKTADVLGKPVAEILDRPEFAAQIKHADREIKRTLAPHIHVHLTAKPHLSMLQFPFRDSAFNWLIAGVVIEHG